MSYLIIRVISKKSPLITLIHAEENEKRLKTSTLVNRQIESGVLQIKFCARFQRVCVICGKNDHITSILGHYIKQKSANT